MAIFNHSGQSGNVNNFLQDITLDRNSQHPKTKITVPQEPDFATSQRAHRTRLEPDVTTEN